MLLISDIHFDPLADPAIVKQLMAAPVSQWQPIFASSRRTGYSRFPNDTNYPLLKSTLTAAAAQAPFDFVIFSGDCLRHNFRNAFISAGGSPNQFAAFATNTAVFVVETLQSAFNLPVYFALGNDDSTCGDYRMDPGGPFLRILSSSLRVLAHRAEAADTFRTAGFYELPHPILHSREILVLNSVLWSRRYSNCGTDGSDAGAAEIDWLSSKLREAKTHDKKVILVMHIPPGMNSYRSSRGGNAASVAGFWLDRYALDFLNLMQNYGGSVQIALAGHTHMDDFRVLSATGARPLVALRMTPAISPIFGNNPAFSVLRYGVRSGAIFDIATYYLNLSNGGTNPQWGLEYRFSSAYGYHIFTPVNLAALAARIRDDPQVRRTFLGYYAVSGRSPITSTNWPFFSCAEVHLTSTDYLHCVRNLPLTSGKAR